MKDYSAYIVLAYTISLLGLGIFLLSTWVQLKKSDNQGDSRET